MVQIAKFEDDFFTIFKKEQRKIVVYGAGIGYQKCKHKIPQIDMLCDQNADQMAEIDGVTIQRPEALMDLKEPIYIIVTPMNHEVFLEIYEKISSFTIDAFVFHAFDNIAFMGSFWVSPMTYYALNPESKLTVNLVCEEQGWILQKFAIRMEEELNKLDVNVMISTDTNAQADINHHIQFANYHPYSNDTLMISHVDSWKLFNTLRRQLETARLGICMSRETMEKLTNYGIPRNKLCYVNPAHDNVIRPRKMVIGITHKTHETDLRKRISAIFEILNGINPNYFQFVIMGIGWEHIIEQLESRGFEVTYYSKFDYNIYTQIVPTFDYYFFMGFDEGSMGYLDAISAGVKTIVTPQGFHLDNDFPIDYPCKTIKEFHNAFLDIQHERERRICSVENWTWSNYTKKHLIIWEYLLKRRPLRDLYNEQLSFEDGIYSMLLEDNRIEYDKSGKTR